MGIRFSGNKRNRDVATTKLVYTIIGTGDLTGGFVFDVEKTPSTEYNEHGIDFNALVDYLKSYDEFSISVTVPDTPDFPVIEYAANQKLRAFFSDLSRNVDLFNKKLIKNETENEYELNLRNFVETVRLEQSAVPLAGMTTVIPSPFHLKAGHKHYGTFITPDAKIVTIVVRKDIQVMFHTFIKRGQREKATANHRVIDTTDFIYAGVNHSITIKDQHDKKFVVCMCKTTGNIACLIGASELHEFKYDLNSTTYIALGVVDILLNGGLPINMFFGPIDNGGSSFVITISTNFHHFYHAKKNATGITVDVLQLPINQGVEQGVFFCHKIPSNLDGHNTAYWECLILEVRASKQVKLKAVNLTASRNVIWELDLPDEPDMSEIATDYIIAMSKKDQFHYIYHRNKSYVQSDAIDQPRHDAWKGPILLGESVNTKWDLNVYRPFPVAKVITNRGYDVLLTLKYETQIPTNVIMDQYQLMSDETDLPRFPRVTASYFKGTLRHFTVARDGSLAVRIFSDDTGTTIAFVKDNFFSAMTEEKMFLNYYFQNFTKQPTDIEQSLKLDFRKYLDSLELTPRTREFQRDITEKMVRLVAADKQTQ